MVPENKSSLLGVNTFRSMVKAQTKQSRQCVIFDLDGCLADHSHRLIHVSGDRRDWPAFERHLDEDPLIEHTAFLLRTIARLPGVAIIICTNRPERQRDRTRQWLTAKDLPVNYLQMRADHDLRTGEHTKVEMLADIRRKGFVPIFAVEDQERIAVMWRANGVPCFLLPTLPGAALIPEAIVT